MDFHIVRHPIVSQIASMFYFRIPVQGKCTAYAIDRHDNYRMHLNASTMSAKLQQ